MAASPKKRQASQKYTCMCCLREKRDVDFYLNPVTQYWAYSNGRVLFCKECMDARYEEYKQRFGEKNATVICCAMLDAPFIATTYQSALEGRAVYNFRLYMNSIFVGRGKTMTFMNSLLEGEFNKSEVEVREKRESVWSASDRRNQNFVLSTIGYDPFADGGLSDEDRKYCFNVIAGYCDADSIQDDGHKVQSIVQLTNIQLQCRKLDDAINMEMNGASPNLERIKTLTGTKKDLLSAAAALAKDNQLSAAHNAASGRGSNTLSNKIKQMSEDGYIPIKVNLFDIKTSEAMKQIADLSHQSILEQLTFDGNDFTEIIKEQRTLIRSLEESRDALAEENRILKLKIGTLGVYKDDG